MLPIPGLFLMYIGAAAGIAAALTVVGLFVAPLVGVLAAGFVAGALLGLLAGPPLMSMPWRLWRKLLWGYGQAGTCGAMVLALGQIVFDPAFANTFGLAMPWLTALGTFATVLIVGVSTSLLAWRGWIRAGLLKVQPKTLLPAFRSPAAVAVLLSVPTQVMIAEGHTIFRPDGNPFPVLASILRGGKPHPPTTLTFAGLTYVGPRDHVVRRGVLLRSHQKTTLVDRGASGAANWSAEVDDSFEQWQLADVSRVGAENIFITADKSALQVTYECEPGFVAGQEFCSRPDPVYREHLNKAFLVALQEDAFLLTSDAPNAVLGIRFDARKPQEPDRRTRARLYCRLNLTAVTEARFSVMQIIPCDADWVMIALDLRARLERNFVMKAAP